MTSSDVAKENLTGCLFLLFVPSPLPSLGNHTAIVDFTGFKANLFHLAAELGRNPSSGRKMLSAGREMALVAFSGQLLLQKEKSPWEYHNLSQISRIFLPK